MGRDLDVSVLDEAESASAVRVLDRRCRFRECERDRSRGERKPVPSSLLFRFVVARLRGLVAELELVKNDADQALAAAEVLRATTAGVGR